MKKFISLFYLSSFIVFSSQATMAGHASVEEYFADMASKGLPKVLIVGCGHLEHGKHLDPSHHQHNNEWCVDVEDSRTYTPKWQLSRQEQSKTEESKEEEINEDEPTWKNLNSDAKLDITVSFPINLQNYKDKFDTVVLERNWSRTLNNNLK